MFKVKSNKKSDCIYLMKLECGCVMSVGDTSTCVGWVEGIADITSVLNFRYQILAPTAVAGGFVDGKKACEKLLDAIQLEKASYRVGTSKVANTIHTLAGKVEGCSISLTILFTCPWHETAVP